MHVEKLLKAVGAMGVLTMVTACAAAPLNKPLKVGTVETGPGTLAEARKYLEGRWTLESFELRPAGRAPIMLKGSGVLNYDDFGNLRMEVRPDEAAADALRAAGIVIRDGIISSDGRTAIDLQNRTLTYFLEGQPASGTGPLATSRPRHWEVTGDVLTLTTRDDSGAPASISRWKKNP